MEDCMQVISHIDLSIIFSRIGLQRMRCYLDGEAFVKFLTRPANVIAALECG
jgi:hypothetical protein